MQNYRASSEDFINIKVKETDSICKPNYRGNLEKPIKENIKLSDRKKKNSQPVKRDVIKHIFISLEAENMVDPLILSTAVHKMIKEEFEAAIYAGPIYACNISWKSKYKVFVNSIQKTV